MAAGNSSRILRSPSRLVVGPTTSPASSPYPYGGKEVGRVNAVGVAAIGNNYRVFYEGLGTGGDMLESEHRWAFTCFLRGWDNDAIQQIFSTGYEIGSVTQHAVFSAPGAKRPGASAYEGYVSLLVVPDDPINNPGLIVYAAVVEMADGANMTWGRAAEFGIPITAECMLDNEGRILSIGRLPDLEIP